VSGFDGVRAGEIRFPLKEKAKTSQTGAQSSRNIHITFKTHQNEILSETLHQVIFNNIETLSKHKYYMRQSTRAATMTGGDYFMSANGGTMLRRIRTPHPHDVLCGRGGGINSHVGNRIFRDWVADRRLDYNLASTKADKARVAKEVMNKVTMQNPPGRFLQRDASGGIGSWWIEITEEKAMAKTSQALREGAPTIRAQHQHSDGSPRIGSINDRTRSYEDTLIDSSMSFNSSFPPPLIPNSEFEQEYYRPTKVAKIDPDGTPTLVAACGSDIPTLHLEPPTVGNPSVSSQDLEVKGSFRDSTWPLEIGHLDEFVNPFENEETALELYRKSLELEHRDSIFQSDASSQITNLISI
jgi:hypothetical protein